MNPVLTALLIPFLGTALGSAFGIGALSGIVEPVGGAMLYVVVEELIPESQSGTHSNIGTIGFAIGFVIMMILDVALG